MFFDPLCTFMFTANSAVPSLDWNADTATGRNNPTLEILPDALPLDETVNIRCEGKAKTVCNCSFGNR